VTGDIEAVLTKNQPTAGLPTATPPANGESVIRHLISESWDAFLVDHWLADHLQDHVHQEPYGLDEDNERQFNLWIEDLCAGKYIRQED
jgi:hypothetical protein